MCFASLHNDITYLHARMFVILPCEELSPFSHFLAIRRQRCVQNDHMVRSPHIEATEICLQTNKSVCTPTPLRRHNTLVFVLLSQIVLAHTKIMQVSSLFFFYRPVEATLKSQAVCSATACFVLTTCKLLEKTTASTSARIICIYICIYIFGATKQSCH